MADYPDPTFSRRGFAQAVAAGSLLMGFSRAGAGAPFSNLPHLDGELSFDPATRAEYANDYGRIVHEQPLAVLRPGSVRDISAMVVFARRFGLKIAARGQGHQPFGQAQVSGGIVIDMRSLQQVHSYTADSVAIDAGASWRSLLQATLSYGLAPPVVTKFLGLTVGGTLAIGGVVRRQGAATPHAREARRRPGHPDVLLEARLVYAAAVPSRGRSARLLHGVAA
jgi:cytokinin dehydrogenase